MSLVWVNGGLIDKSEARVSPFDHGFLYGDGVWEPLRVFGGRLFRPEEHLDLLRSAAAALDIAFPLSHEELIAAIEATLRANHRTDGYIRVIVTRGPGTIGPDPRKIDPQVIIVAEEYQPFPLQLVGHGLNAATVPVPAGNPPLRLLGRPHIVHAKRMALRQGCLEAVMLHGDEHGNVAGATEGSLLLVRGGAVILAGEQPAEVAASAAEAIATEAGRLVAEPTVPACDLFDADEVFLAGTSCGIIGIVRIDGKDIGSGMEGPVTRSIREAHDRLTRG
jgi:branched-chain amino acid aminotransferase